MNTVFIPFEMYSLGCTQLNTIAIVNTAFKLYLNALSTGLYTDPRYAGFFWSGLYTAKNYRSET